ncbi:MAG TPA: hypothetical protein VIX12_09340 [Candidatus Binataceae bacterium]
MSPARTDYQLCYRRQSDGSYKIVLINLVIETNGLQPTLWEARVISVDEHKQTAHLRIHAEGIVKVFVFLIIPIHVPASLDAEDEIT